MTGQREFEEFYLVTRMRLLRQLTIMIGDAEEAADALQEAYARGWQRWRRVSGLDNPEAWVRTVAWRVAVSHHRRSLVAADRLRRLFRPEDVADPALDRDTAMDLQTALRRLNPEHRRALVLYEMCGMTVSQVAAETRAPEGTVKSRLSRARDALSAALGEDYLSGPSEQPVEGRLT